MSGHFGGSGAEESEEPYVYTSIRYDRRLVDSAKNTAASCNKPNPFYMLEHHWTRLQVAQWSTFFFASDRPRPHSGGPSVVYRVLLNAVKQWHESHPGESPEALRIKLRSFVGGKMTTEIYHPLKGVSMSALFPSTFDLPSDQQATDWTIVLDTEPTEPGEGTMFKTNDRSAYARSRAAAQIMTYMIPKEVLLYTSDKQILDASICTPYFHRKGRWVTPPAAAGGLQGTTRRWALENKLAHEDSIHIDSLVDGEVVWLSNAVRGYFWAIFRNRNTAPDELDPAAVAKIDREHWTHPGP